MLIARTERAEVAYGQHELLTNQGISPTSPERGIENLIAGDGVNNKLRGIVWHVGRYSETKSGLARKGNLGYLLLY